MTICKICNRERKLKYHNPYYGIIGDKGKKRVKICEACSQILKEHCTKSYTGVLQSQLWNRQPENSLDALMRPMRRINYMVRFSGEVTANPESLAEHSYFVLLYAIQIAKSLVEQDIDFEKLVSMAMFHDTPEILVGDIPTPLKQGAIKKENEKLEQAAIEHLNNWGVYIGRVSEYDANNKDDLESRIVKCADLVSAVVYCTEEIFIGSHNLESALLNSVKKMFKFVHHDWEKKLLGMILEYVNQALDWDLTKVLLS